MHRAPAWDRLQADWSVLQGALPDRTRDFDALLASRDGLNPARHGYDSARLVREYLRRVTYWGERLGMEEALGEAPGAGRLRGRRVERILVVGGSILAVGLIALGWRTSWPVAAIGAFGLGATVIALALATRHSERPRLGEALLRRLCPDCGYELRGLPPAIPPDVVGGCDLGPAACPECGSAWPCVPPPAPVASLDPGTESPPPEEHARGA